MYILGEGVASIFKNGGIIFERIEGLASGLGGMLPQKNFFYNLAPSRVSTDIIMT